MTPNPNDRILYRVVNNAPPKGANLGITHFSLLYFSVVRRYAEIPYYKSRTNLGYANNRSSRKQCGGFAPV